MFSPDFQRHTSFHSQVNLLNQLPFLPWTSPPLQALCCRTDQWDDRIRSRLGRKAGIRGQQHQKQNHKIPGDHFEDLQDPQSLKASVG